MLRKRLPYIQSIQFALYKDCKRVSKKDHGLPVNDDDRLISTDDEQLVHFMLENSSITDHDSPRSFQGVASAIDNICHQLCPGEWCKRSHCKNYSSHRAYNCGAHKRPSVCKEYKQYIERKKQRELENAGK